MNVPETRYAKTVDGVNIAYQMRGHGPVDLIRVTGNVSNFEIELEEPRTADYFDGLALFSRLILFDMRGTGLSDRANRRTSRSAPRIFGPCWTRPARSERSSSAM